MEVGGISVSRVEKILLNSAYICQFPSRRGSIGSFFMRRAPLEHASDFTESSTHIFPFFASEIAYQAISATCEQIWMNIVFPAKKLRYVGVEKRRDQSNYADVTHL